MGRKRIIPWILLVCIFLFIIIYNSFTFLYAGTTTWELGITVENNYITGSNDWKTAEAKFQNFVQEYLVKMRELDERNLRAKLPDYKFDREFAEIKSQIISKYLVDYRIFTDKHFNFALNKDGHIIVLGKTMPGNFSYSTTPDFETINESSLLNRLGIKIINGETAIEVVKLIESIFKIHGSVDDSGRKHWTMRAEKVEDIWKIEVKYVGPLGYSIAVPPYWEIVVDSQDNVKEFREVILN